MWGLGTSPASAVHAARRGLPYAFGGFLDPRALVPSLTAYRQHFEPGAGGVSPRVNLAWYVQTAATEAEAHALTRSSEHWFVETFLRGGNPPLPAPGARYSAMEQLAIGHGRAGARSRALSW